MAVKTEERGRARGRGRRETGEERESERERERKREREISRKKVLLVTFSRTLACVCRFNVRCALSVCSVLSDQTFGMKIAPDGSLFGEVTLKEVLNDGSEGGQLILSSCSTVLLTRSDLASVERPTVYEAEIVPGIKRKDVVYIKLPESCVAALVLSNGMTVDAEIQFQLNRSNFVRMHEAVDAVRTTNNLPLLFPLSPAYGQPDRRTARYS